MFTRSYCQTVFQVFYPFVLSFVLFFFNLCLLVPIANPFFKFFILLGYRCVCFFFRFLTMLWLFKLCLLAKQGDKVCFGLFWLSIIYTFLVVWFCVFFSLFLLDKTFG